MLFFRRRRPAARCYVIAESQSRSAPAASHTLKAIGARARLAARTRQRIALCALGFAAAYVLLGFRLVFVSIGGPELSAGVSPVAASQLGSRPEIVDRHGVILATNLPMIALEVAGREIWDAEETAHALAKAFPEIDGDDLAARLQSGRYVEVLSNLTPTQQETAFALGLPGLRFSARERRFYPQERLAAHVIGHTEPGKGGVMGLEKVLESELRGDRLTASIDARVQQALEEELSEAVETFQAEAAWGAVMDVASGEMLALASLPDFDPNEPGAAPADSRRNRATYDRYELGSAFKAITAASALEAGVASESKTYDARGAFRVADRSIRDFHGKNRVLSFSEVIQHSSNIGAARMAGDLGATRQKEFLKNLGLFDALTIELAENRTPELPWQWGPVEAATIAYGHGISVTPLHLLAAFAATINDGAFRIPTFIANHEEAGGKRVFSLETVKVMRRVLRRTVVDGTAGFAEVEGYFPIGKTSTANKPSPNGGYDDNARIATFVGAFPGYAPEYAVLVSLDNPQATAQTHGFTGAGWNAAPVFANVVSRIAPILGVMPVSENVAHRGFVDHIGVSALQTKRDEADG